MTSTPTFKRSLETQNLIAALNKMQANEVQNTSDLLTQCSIPAEKFNGCYQTATKYLRKLDNGGKVFRRENKTVIRLSDKAKLDAQAQLQRRINRTAKRQLQELVTVKYEALPPDEKRRHCALASISGALAAMSAPRTQKKIAAHITASQQRLPIEATLGLFMAKADESKT